MSEVRFAQRGRLSHCRTTPKKKTQAPTINVHNERKDKTPQVSDIKERKGKRVQNE